MLFQRMIRKIKTKLEIGTVYSGEWVVINDYKDRGLFETGKFFILFYTGFNKIVLNNSLQHPFYL